MHAMAKKLNKSNIEIFVALCWAIWYGRNNQIFQGKKLNHFLTVTRAEVVLEAYKRVKQQGQGAEAKHNSSTQQNWIPLPANVFKVNIDAIVNFGKQLTRLGVVIETLIAKL